jgi:hypothetical protein
MATALESQLYTRAVPMAFAKYLIDWITDSDNTNINILVIGETGSGKSTLVNSVLGFSKVKERQELQRTKIVELKRWQNTIGSVQVSMWDSPGLGGQPANEKDRKEKDKAIEAIKNNCRDVDLCLFCCDMSNTRYFPEYCEETKVLCEIFGKDIWKHTIFALTFANKFLLRIEDDFRGNPNGMKQKFVHQVKLWKQKIHMHLEKQKIDPKIVKSTEVVPVGNHRTHQLFADDDTKWLNELWLQVTGAIRHTAKPAALKICQQLLEKPVSDQMDQLSVTLSLVARETPRTSYAHATDQEMDLDDDKPQGQSIPLQVMMSRANIS